METLKPLLVIRFLLFIFIFFLGSEAKADFGIWASAVYLDINGSPAFYNTQKNSTLGNIGAASFSSNLGVFGQNSGNLILEGAELRTFKSPSNNICGGYLYYTVYPATARPASPEFSSIYLPATCNCNGSSFAGCGGGACGNVYDQKFQAVNRSVDLTAYTAGDYVLEVYFQINGENSSINSCTASKIDNADGNNYRTGFTISAPLFISYYGFNGICTDNSIKLRWIMQSEDDITKYEIEKSSNGLLFTNIATINSYSGAQGSYYFYDRNPIIGTNYYRIKMYHKNTAVNISNVVRIYFGKVGNTIFIYPNPTGTELNVRFAAVDKGDYQLSVINNNGQKIVSVPVKHDGLDRTIQINLPKTLSKGLYRLFMIDKSRFFKQAFLF